MAWQCDPKVVFVNLRKREEKVYKVYKMLAVIWCSSSAKSLNV